MSLYHKEGKCIKKPLSKVETLLPHKYELMPNDRVTIEWFKKLVKSACGKEEVYSKRKSFNKIIPLSLFLFNLYKEELIQCYEGGWIGPGILTNDAGKKQMIKNYQYVHLRRCLSTEKNKQDEKAFELSGEQLVRLFHDRNINKPPRDSENRENDRNQVNECFNKVWKKTGKELCNKG